MWRAVRISVFFLLSLKNFPIRKKTLPTLISFISLGVFLFSRTRISKLKSSYLNIFFSWFSATHVLYAPSCYTFFDSVTFTVLSKRKFIKRHKLGCWNSNFFRNRRRIHAPTIARFKVMHIFFSFLIDNVTKVLFVTKFFS